MRNTFNIHISNDHSAWTRAVLSVRYGGLETVVIETSGVFGKQTLSFLMDLACHVRKVSGEMQFFNYLLQHLAVAVQRGNAFSVLGTFTSEDCLVF